MRGGRFLVWHAPLFAVWPVVTLYAENLAEVAIAEALAAVGVVAAAALAAQVLLTAMLRDARRAALMTSVLALTVMLWGTVADATGDPSWLFPLWVGVAVLACAALLRLRSGLRELSLVAALTSAVILVFALVPVLLVKGPIVLAAEASAAPIEELDAAVGRWSAGGQPRDIYYLVFDRYGSQEAMQDRWNVDLSPFFDRLRERGFYVAEASKANHLRTAQSLASTLNLRYLLDMEERYGPDTNDMLPVFDLLRDHAVGRLLQDRGYRYVHIGPWWDPTQQNPHADVNLPYETSSDFRSALHRLTLLSWFDSGPTGRARVEQNRHVPYDGARHQFAAIRRAAAAAEPTFVFAHVLLPHEPFVFDRDGDYVSFDEQAARSRQRNYVEQTLYTNEQIVSLVGDLLDMPPAQQPIIVLAADEGPSPVRFIADDEDFDWTTATAAELEEKFAILNAYYLPDGRDAALYPSISPVNSWRVIFNGYFGADLPLLPDRSYVFRNERHVYDFTDVTDRLGGPIP